MIDNKSFIELPSSEVKKICEQTINHITEVRTKRDKETEDGWIEEQNKPSFFQNLFHIKPKQHTKEDFIKYLRSTGVHAGLLYRYPSIYAWEDLEIAEKLLHAANLKPNGTIYVNVEELCRVSR